ncbi:MAG TPA: phosphate ABC transporter permease PstA [Actinomycetota bacterium]|nr:phosphate ABC transporter permease PstA [Actinomycetota bacterium]
MSARSEALSTTDIVRRSLTGKKRDWRSVVFEGFLLLMLLFSLLILITLLTDVIGGGFSVLTDRGADFVGSGISSLPERAGVYQGLIGSFLMMVFVVIVAFPIGIGAAVYLEEYAPDTKFTRFINVNIRNLAGVPSVVYGLLGLAIFVKLLAVNTGGRSIISGGLTLAILALPIVIITAAEALRAVPQSIREAGFGVGATRWEVVRSHVLPSAAPGILTGCVLSISRALGETAPLLLVGATTGFLASGGLYDQLYSPFTSLPTIIFAWAKEPDPGFRELTSAAIIVLLGVILTANAAAIFLRNRYERKW